MKLFLYKCEGFFHGYSLLKSEELQEYTITEKKKIYNEVFLISNRVLTKIHTFHFS